MTTGPRQATEGPALSVPRPPSLRHSPLGLAFVASACVAAVSAAAVLFLLATRPAPPVTVRGIMASKQDFFNDREVQRLLLAHGVRVEVTARGSGEVAYEVLNQKSERYDFAFPSGQPAADQIKARRQERGLHSVTTRLFSSPIVLATFREYAETLVRNDAATRHGNGSAPSLYYTLETAPFLEFGRQGKTWNDIGLGHEAGPDGTPVSNGNRVLARTSGVCRTNSGATYLGLVAFVVNGEEPAQTAADADRLAARIQPIFAATGMAESELWRTYVTPEGRSQGPVVVVYEHQFFAYQLDQVRRTGRPDGERVLLYPRQEFLTDPEYISLKPSGDRLGVLLRTDPALRGRMMELGFRVMDDADTTGTGTGRLFGFLTANGVPPPAPRTDFTRAELPVLALLQRMVETVDGCGR
ncbi:hypothetical protein EDD29_2608 [Actinocorallia herbida]|uniref:Extracellular solute-binding protein n=1 Tax=Actinocorallia herbida TaxID=58109 RepID=A0A3N1CUT6_9ACTN|nr:hypothetical protein [Actinocorallia herbida]ROO85073.1 hypothetical protein EDD29_2608 [Actinocorallia herbida]